ncbi:MAG: DUF1071 domain-containing protein, partial [Bacteroidales bacterium]|nr:DUF1071 domain-containing protein [Bacteroidales bacterium]
MEKSVFETLSSVNVNGHTETKKQSGAQLTYLSWCWAWAEVVKRYPDASYTIVENADGNHFFASRYGIEVRTTVTINGVTHPMWLPVMDGTNHAMKDEPYTYTVKGYNGNP